MSTGAALRNWEAENEILTIDPDKNALYKLPEEKAYKQLRDETRPWKDDPNYFTEVKISALALLKMTMHARSGGAIEIMGLMTGYVAGKTFVITDAFRLPVEATETRVNAQQDAYEYMSNFPEMSRETDRQEDLIGWYHSHPGYACWLSGIDVATQKTWQQGNTPFVAIVIDPNRTISAGKVEIGAFRTYPDNYRPSDQVQDDGFQAIPTGKIEDFGAHANDYYALEISHYKSTLDQQLIDLLWNKYWTSTISQSPLFTNAEYTRLQMADHSIKVKDTTKKLKPGGGGGGPRRAGAELSASSDNKTNFRVVPDKSIEQIVKSGNKISREALAGLLANDVKQKLFLGVIEEARINAASAQAIDAAAGSAAVTT